MKSHEHGLDLADLLKELITRVHAGRTGNPRVHAFLKGLRYRELPTYFRNSRL